MKTPEQILHEHGILPAYWASALVNNDYSGMTDEEEQDINNWLERTKPGYCVGCSEEQYFSWRNDATTLGSDVLEFYFHVTSL